MCCWTLFWPILIRIQLDATGCRYLFTAKSLYMHGTMSLFWPLCFWCVSEGWFTIFCDIFISVYVPNVFPLMCVCAWKPSSRSTVNLCAFVISSFHIRTCSVHQTIFFFFFSTNVISSKIQIIFLYTNFLKKFSLISCLLPQNILCFPEQFLYQIFSNLTGLWVHIYIYRVRQRIGRFGNGVFLFLAWAGKRNDAAR